ncbi:uncharacterized protein C2845_PM05G15210 [Panicum miliaceum]|uniref:Rx N-terminal domain-containing protein n=1 Tax=Panicum miliaceum TaxID=4540 RepID=A0A3L6SX47_PANMI|nr:uncharacterized protein C2845_PM05G15210 [Panicum miliaceum]
MTGMVGSAVAEETLKQVVSSVLIGKQRQEEETAEQLVERLEMAQIKLEAALETSRGWHISDASLLRWRRKLKHAAQECDDTLRQCKQRAVEDEAREREVRGSSFPRRLAHATRSLLAALLRRDGSLASSAAAVRRFEWLAGGAGEFLRFVELGGTPRRYAFFDPLIGRLLAGQELRYRTVRRSQYHLFCVRPVRLDDRGVEAKLLFLYEDDEAPEKNLCLGSILRLSESTDLVGTVVKCLELLVTPHFKPTAESVSKELAQLPTQDFWWVPDVDSSHKKHWNSIHSSMTQWFRPDPLCCKQHEPKPSYGGSSSSSSTMKLSDVADPVEPVIEVALQLHIPLSGYNKHSSNAGEGDSSCLKNVPHLKMHLLFAPHGGSEGLLPSVESSAIEVIDGVEQSGAHTNISLEQLDELVLPKAIDCLRRKAELTVYQMFWRSKHGAAFLQVGKTGLMKMPPRHATGVGDRRLMIQRRRDPKLEKWVQLVKDFLDQCVAHAPRKLQSSIVEWIQKVDEKQVACQAT